MKIVYAGTPQYAVAPLQSLLESGYEVIAVITQPDKPVGRKGALTPTPVKTFAQKSGIKVIDYPRLRDRADEIISLGADLMITCAYGQILSQEILSAFPKGVYNMHASLLPKYRGASPIQSAVLAGEEYTGVTVMKTELSLDSGGILFAEKCAVDGMTYGELSEKLSALSAQAAVKAAEILVNGEPELIPQDESAATFCKKISKAEARVNFAKTAQEVANLINAYSPSPAAFAYLSSNPVNLLKATVCDGTGEVGTVLSADKKGVVIACKDGAVNIGRLQFAGGKPLSAADAVNGRKIKAGDRFD